VATRPTSSTCPGTVVRVIGAPPSGSPSAQRASVSHDVHGRESLSEATRTSTRSQVPTGVRAFHDGMSSRAAKLECTTGDSHDLAP